MADYLLDSNILLRIDDALADHSPVARGAFRSLIAEGQNCLYYPTGHWRLFFCGYTASEFKWPGLGIQERSGGT